MSIFDRIDPGRIIHDIENNINRVKDQAFHGIEAVANDARHGIEQAAQNAQHGVEQAAQNAQHGVEQIVGNAEHQIEQAVNQATHEIEQKAKDAARAAEHLISGGLATVEHAFSEIGFHEALSKSLAAAERYPIYPNSVGFGLSVVKIRWGDIPEKIEIIRPYVDAPPKQRDDWITFFKTLAPSSLTIDGSIEVFASVFSIAVDVEYTSDQIATVITHVLDDVGIH